jgi:hypothetical protein
MAPKQYHDGVDVQHIGSRENQQLNARIGAGEVLKTRLMIDENKALRL